MAFVPYSFAFFRWKDFETWGLLSQSLGTACLGESSPTWHIPNGCGVFQGSTHVVSYGGTNASICALYLRSTMTGARVWLVYFERCQELKERPSGNTQQRDRPHFLETSPVINRRHPSCRVGKIGIHWEGLCGFGHFYHWSAPVPWSHESLAAFFCSLWFPK